MGLVRGVLVLVLGIGLLVGALAAIAFAVIGAGPLRMVATFSPAMFAASILCMIVAVLNLREGD